MGLLDFIGDRLKVLHKSGSMPTGKSKEGFHFVWTGKRAAIVVVSKGSVYNLWDNDNYKTKAETDLVFNDHAKSIDVLSTTKADKSQLQAVVQGINKLPAVDTYNDTGNGKTSLLSKYPNPKHGDDVLVRKDETKGGISNRYCWNNDLKQWVDMETGLYDEAIEFSSIYPYKEGEKGAHIPILKNAIKGLYIYPEFLKPELKYHIGSIVRTSDLSEITLYSIDSSGTYNNVERIEITGSANDGSVKLYQKLRFSILIDWGEIPVGSVFRSMFNGYELDPLCFSRQNPLNQALNSVNQNYPFKITSTGANIDLLKRAIQDVFIDPQIIESGKKYYIASVLRNSGGVSQVSLFSKRASDGATSNMEALKITGDAANGNVQILKGEKFVIKINWDALNDSSSFTNMFDGYELDELCFSYDNPLSKVFVSEKQQYPYKITSTRSNIRPLHQAISNVFIHPYIVEEGKKYYLTVIRKNDNGQSQVGVYSKRLSDGATSLVESVYPTDTTGIQLVKGKSFLIKVNWDLLKEGARFTNMFEGYELDDMCFSFENDLYTSVSYGESVKSGSLPQFMTLFIKGYTDKRNGYLSTAPNWYASDYIPVTLGDKIRYIGNVYGNGTIIGYPEESPTGFIPLHDTNVTNAIDNRVVEFTIPEGVNFIRVCINGSTKCILTWLEGTPPVFAKNIIIKSGDLNIGAKRTISQLSEVGIMKFQNKADVPNENYSMALIDGKLCFIAGGKVFELNMTEK